MIFAIILIRIGGVFEEFSGFGNVIDGMREWGREIGTQGTCQPVELGRNSVNWTPGGSQARLRAVAFDARITAGSNFNQITSVTRCFRYARTATDRSFSSLPRELRDAYDDGEIERGFLIKNLLPTCSLNDGSLVEVHSANRSLCQLNNKFKCIKKYTFFIYIQIIKFQRLMQ